MRAYKYRGASHSLPFPRYCCIYLQNMNGYYELSPPSCVLPSPFPAKAGGGAKKRQRRWIPFLQLLPACGGQDAIGSAPCASQSCSLSNSKQRRQTAKLSSDVCVRLSEQGVRDALCHRQPGSPREAMPASREGSDSTGDPCPTSSHQQIRLGLLCF